MAIKEVTKRNWDSPLSPTSNICGSQKNSKYNNPQWNVDYSKFYPSMGRSNALSVREFNSWPVPGRLKRMPKRAVEKLWFSRFTSMLELEQRKVVRFSSFREIRQKVPLSSRRREYAEWHLHGGSCFHSRKVRRKRAATGSPYSRPSLLDGQHSGTATVLLGRRLVLWREPAEVELLWADCSKPFSGRFCCLRKSLWKRGYRWKGRFCQGVFTVGLQ